MKKEAITAAVVGLLLFIPLAVFLRTPQSKLRFAEVNIFADRALAAKSSVQIARDDNAAWSRIIHNRRFAYGVEYMQHYFDNLSPQFLFIKGDGNPKFSIQDVGQLYIWEIPFFISGIFFLFKYKSKYWWIVPLWLIIGIAPAATARETPHALRIEATVPTFQILTALGLYYLLSYIPKKTFVKSLNFRKLTVSLVSIVIVINFLYFVYNYFVHYSREFSGEWQYGYKEAITYVNLVKNSYNSVYITTTLGRPYAYVLFYSKYDPGAFRKEAHIRREVLGFVHVDSFDSYHFFEKVDRLEGKEILIIDTPGNVPRGATIQKEFKMLNGQAALVAYIL